LNRSAIVIALMSAQSDPIKRRTLYILSVFVYDR
jgi:hypothetical protein